MRKYLAGLALIGIAGAAGAVPAKFVKDPSSYTLSPDEPLWDVSYKGRPYVEANFQLFNVHGWWPNLGTYDLYKIIRIGTNGGTAGSANMAVAPLAPPTTLHYLYCSVGGVTKVRFTITNKDGTVTREVAVTNKLAITPGFLVNAAPTFVSIEVADLDPHALPSVTDPKNVWSVTNCIVGLSLF